MRFIRNDLDVYATLNGIIETSANGTRANIQLTRAKGRDHARCGIEGLEFWLDPLLLEIARCERDIESYIAARIDDADAYSIKRARRMASRQESECGGKTG
jgi:hypothetical protein